MAINGADIELLFGVAGGDSVSDGSGKLIRDQLNNIVATLNNASHTKERLIRVSLDMENTKTALAKSLETISRQITGQNKFRIKLAKIDADSAIKDLQSRIQSVLSTLSIKNGMSVSIKDFTSGGQITGDPGGATSLADASARATEYAGQLATVRNLIKSINATELRLLNGSGADAQQVADMLHRIQTLRNELNAFMQVKNQPNQGLVDAAIAEAEAINADTAAIQENTTATRNRGNADAEANKALDKSNKLITQSTINLQKWTAAQNGRSSASYAGIDGAVKALKDLNAQFLAGNVSPDIYAQKVDQIDRSISQYNADIQRAGENTKSFSDRIGGLASKFSTWFSLTRVIMAAFRAIKQMVNNVIELDSAMTQLKIVTGASDSQMNTFLKNATAQAKELGQSVTDVLKSIETFSRLGYNLDESSILAKYTGILANVAGVGSEEATTGVTSIIKGFNMDVSETEHVADVLIEVGQKYAVSAAELMEAFEKSGAALNATNTSFEKSAGLIAAANASVQNASTVGTALKTISARIRGSKSELSELGEDPSELADGFSKYAKELQALTGFDIMVDGTTNTFKDIYDILQGIASVWDKLSDTQQARVAEILGGTRQLQVISSILGNWQDAAGAYQSAMESAGTATEANATYMESIEGKIGQFKATFQELSATLIDSDFVKQFVELGTRLLEILNEVAKLIDAIGGLNTVLAITSGLIVSANLPRIVAWLGKIGAKLLNGNLVRGFQAIHAGLISMKTGSEAAASAFTMLGGTATALSAGLTALVAIIGIAFAAYQALHKSSEELRQEYDAVAAECDELNSELLTTKERIAELQALSNAGTITLADAEELKNLRLTNDELERKLRLKQAEKQIANDKSNKSIENDWNNRRYDNMDLVTAASSDMNAIFESAPDGFELTDSGTALVNMYGLTDEQVALAWDAAEAYNILYDQITNYDTDRLNGLDDVGPEEYITRLIDRYQTLMKLGAQVSSAQLEERNALHDTLVSLGTDIEDNFIGMYVGDGDIVDKWKEISNSIDAAIFPAEHFSGLLAKLPEQVQHALSAKVVGGMTPQKVEELAGAYGELSQWMKDSGYTAEDVAKHYNALGKSQNDLLNTDNPLEHFGADDVVEKIAKAETEINKIGKVLGDFSENGAVSAVTLETLRETFGDCEEFQNFVDVMSSADSTMDQAQAAANALAKEWINQLDLLSLVDEDTAGAVEALLKLTGVTNAHEVVEAQLNNVRAQAWIEANNLTDATATEVEQKLKDVGVTDALRRAIWDHKFATEAAKIATSEYNGTLTNQIGLLASIAAKAGIATSSLAALAELQSLTDRYESGELKNSRYWMNNDSGHTKNRYEERVEELSQKVQEEFSKLLNPGVPMTIDVPEVKSGNSKKKKDDKEVEKYIADIDRLRKKKEMLRRQELEDSRISDLISRTDDSIDGLKERIALTQQLIDGYEEENRQLHELAGAYRENGEYDYDTARAEILEKINKFESDYGIQIQYNAQTNELLCDDLEKINQLTADNSKNYDTAAEKQEATNKLIQQAEKDYKEIVDLNKENIERSAQYEENVGKIHEKNKENLETLKQIVEVASSMVDEVQGVYDTLQKAADEYAANDGFISVDTFQEITAAGLEYMQYLTDENGLLVMERENIKALIKAKTEQMALLAAESYVERIKAAAYGESTESLNRLTLAQDANTLSTWNALEAEVEKLHMLGKLSDVQYAGALENIHNYRMILTGVNVEFDAHADKMTKANESMDKILEYTIELVKQQVQDEIDGLNDLVDQYNKLIDAKKEALDKTKEEDDYADEMLEKTKQLAKLRTDADLLRLAANSGDRGAEAKLVKNLEEQNELQKEIDEKQRDHAIDAQKEALDKMAEDYKEQKDDEIEELEKSISSQQKLYDKAITYIDKHWSTLYSDLLTWNHEYGSTIDLEITQNWVAANNAMKEYGKTYRELVEERNAKQYGTFDTTINKDGTSTVTQTSPAQNDAVAKNRLTEVNNKVIDMQTNSEDWKSTSDPKARSWLAEENTRLAGEVERLLNVKLERKSDGAWYLPDGRRLYDVYGGKFHSGGIVGGGTLLENERLAVLQKGEPIISNAHKQSLFDLVDFATVLSNRLGDISPAGLDLVSPARNERLMERLMEAGTGSAPSIHFGDVYIYGGNDETVRKHKEVNREFANEVLKYLHIKP